ncbi:hypothetical protein C8R47DRAFT_212593 [Mycena vitilis]|nr:hypothetical protein C8R47DRAFT_212593 [Mycena vitilis]
MQCRQLTEDGRCPCEEYDPPQDPMARSVCRECEHGKSLHKPPPNGNGETVQGKGTIKDIFAAHSAKGLKDLKPLADFSTARNDALKGFRVEPEASTNKKISKKGKAKAEPKPKTVPIKVVLLTNGVKNDKLKGSSRALNSSDIGHREQHGCVAKDVNIDPTWTHRECSKHFAKLFPKAFAEAKGDKARSSWSVVEKSYQQLRVVPKSAPPTGADILQEKIVTRRGDVMVYIVLNKTVTEKTFKTWYTGPPRQEPSSDIDEDPITISDQSSTASDVDVDIDMDSSNEEEMQFEPNPYGMPYKMGPKPGSSKRKIESLDSDIEEKPFKKQKLAPRRQRPTSAGSSSKVGNGLFLTPDSDREWTPPVFQSTPPQSIAQSIAPIAPIDGPSQPPFTQRLPRVSLLLPKVTSTDAGQVKDPSPAPDPSPATKEEPKKKKKCTSCRRLVSAPPKAVVARLEFPWEEAEKRRRESATDVNPWHPKYAPPGY